MIGRTSSVAILFAALIIGLSNSSLHPTSGSGGYTGAPGDSSCGNCHTGNNTNLDGDITIDGLPATIETGETYTLTVTITNPNGNAVKSGFQMVALNGTNGNAGTMTSPSANTQIRVAGGKNYFGHSPAQNFPSSNTLSFTVDWTAPATAGSVPLIKFYACSVIANGANGNQNDKVVFTNVQVPIQSVTVPLSLSITDVEGVSCAGLSNGMATATVGGGTPPYTYSWNNGINTATNTTLPAGNASVTVTDNAGNSINANTNIPSPSPIITSTSGSNICLDAENGTASVTATGGTGTKTYTWSNGQTGNSISGLSSGTYFVTVEDANGCTGTNAAVVGIIPNPVYTSSVIDVLCHGTATGSISLTLQSPPSGITYNWSNGAASVSITNLAAGSYSVTVTNASGCSATSTYSVTQPDPLLATAIQQNQILCFGGETGGVLASANGGTPPYSFVWSTGATGTGLSHSVSQLPAGSYGVSITDQKGCLTQASQAISSPPLLVLEATNADTFLCPGESNAFIELGLTGGTLPYQLLWSNGATTAKVEDLASGLYSVTVSDGNQCTQLGQFEVIASALSIDSILVTQPSSATSNDGLLEVWFAGQSPMQFAWIKDGVLIDSDSIVSNAGTGMYEIILTEPGGCTVSVDSILLTAPSNIYKNDSEHLIVYPVPVSDFVTLKFGSLGAVDRIMLTDIKGNRLPVMVESQSHGILQLDLSHLVTGSYILTLVSGERIWVRRINVISR